MWVRTLLTVALGALGLLVGCTNHPRARSVIAPDGAPAFHVSCGSDQGACFELAGDNCPGGYRMKPIFDPASNNFLVRCEAHARVATPPASTVVIRTLAPASATTVPSSAAATTAGWPPPAQPWTPADPWPESAASGAGSLPETARAPSGQIDIGY